MKIGLRLAVAIAALGLAANLKAQNLVPDPAFVSGVSAWKYQVAPGLPTNYTMTFAPGVSRRPGSGSGLLSSVASPGNYSVCVNVRGGVRYATGYSLLFPDPNRLTGFSEVFTEFDGPDCTGTGSGGLVTLLLPVNVWGDFKIPRTLLPGTRSVQLGISALGIPGVQPLAYIDDVYIGVEGTVPPIDPPAPVPAASVPGLAALALLIAVAGLRVLRP